MAEYPEHEKLAAVKEKSQAIGEFLDFGLGRQGITLCAYDECEDEFFPTSKSVERILAEHFDIDLEKIDQEKRAMLEALRAA